MRLFASRRMRTSWASGDSSEPCASVKASTASREATSPAFAPPMPSATAKKGGAITSESSLVCRWRPTSVAPALSTTPSMRLLLVAVLAVADLDQVGRLEALRASQLAAVQVGPVRRAHVLDVHELPMRIDARVSGGGERIVDLDVGAVRAAHVRSLAHLENRPRLVAHSRHDVEAGRHSRAQVRHRTAVAMPRRLRRLGSG